MEVKTALVLEGGAMRGIFSAGVIDVMMEEGISYDLVIGVSAGAAFGCNYKSQQIGRALRYNLRYVREWKYGSLRSLLLTGDYYGAQFCYRLLPQVLDAMDATTYNENPMKFMVVATDVFTGKPLYKELPLLNEEALHWIRGSASMPLFSRPVKAGPYTLLDGGISDSIPVKYVKDLGYDRIVAVLTRPSSYQKKKMDLRAFKPLLRKYPLTYRALVNRPQKYNETTAYIRSLEEKNDIFVIRPEKKLEIRRTEHNPKRILGVYEEGRLLMEKKLPLLKNYLQFPSETVLRT